MDVDKCVCCGQPVPEGRMICWICENVEVRKVNEKLKAAVYGFAVGDALGVPYEFKKRGSFKCKGMTGFGTHNQPPGTWSDDTSMILATCDSIRICDGIFPDDIMIHFEKWLNTGAYTPHGKVFDVGNTTAQAISNLSRIGFPAVRCGLSDEWSKGNGSLMRILPIAFVQGFDWEDVENVSKLTHAHTVCIQKCCELVWYCSNLIKNPDFLIPHCITRKKKKDIISSGYVVTTLEAALWCLGTSKSYKEAVLKAVNLGGDTDTIAAITGGLAALKWGYSAIPEEWIDQLANKELIDSCLF